MLLTTVSKIINTGPSPQGHIAHHKNLAETQFGLKTESERCYMSNMKFKEGHRVEVCRSDGGTLRSWYRARIISHNRDCYRVQYDNLLNDHGKHVVEDVYADIVRPEPPTMTETRKLGPGDLIEVYDNHSWREGRVIKALPSRLFVVKLMEPLRQRSFHQSVIRPRLFWENDSWLHHVEVGRDHLARMKFQVQKELHIGCQFQEQNVKRNTACQEYEQVVAEYHLHKLISKNAKRKPGSCMQSAYEGDLKTEAAPQKRRLIQKFRDQEAVAHSSFPMLEKIHGTIGKKGGNKIG
ncbi:hypothetical protein SUGI_0701120 [Cryptomeria japonica]|nr:hypothetical protein SUGI_0701120 [Cryptomeria japonica]